MSGTPVTSLGARLAYAVESTKGTRPSAFTAVGDITSLPDLNSAPSNLDTTDLSRKNNKTYTSGLKDLGTAEFGANMTPELLAQWNTTVCGAYETNKTSGKAVWFEIYFPDMNQAEYFTGEPLPIFTNEVGIDSVVSTTARVNITGDVEWATAIVPTDTTASA